MASHRFNAVRVSIIFNILISPKMVRCWPWILCGVVPWRCRVVWMTLMSVIISGFSSFENYCTCASLKLYKCFVFSDRNLCAGWSTTMHCQIYLLMQSLSHIHLMLTGKWNHCLHALWWWPLNRSRCCDMLGVCHSNFLTVSWISHNFLDEFYVIYHTNLPQIWEQVIKFPQFSPKVQVVCHFWFVLPPAMPVLLKIPVLSKMSKWHWCWLVLLSRLCQNGKVVVTFTWFQRPQDVAF